MRELILNTVFPLADSQTVQEARVDCVSLFVSIASGSCHWQVSFLLCASSAEAIKNDSAASMKRTDLHTSDLGRAGRVNGRESTRLKRRKGFLRVKSAQLKKSVEGLCIEASFLKGDCRKRW